MQVTVDTRQDTLEQALAVIRLAFAHEKKATSAHEGTPTPVVKNTPPRRARAASRKASTKQPAPEQTDNKKPSAKKRPAQTNPIKNGAPTNAAEKISRSAASSQNGRSNAAPPGQADLVRAWARDQGMEVKAAGRMPAAVISAYNDAHN